MGALRRHDDDALLTRRVDEVLHYLWDPVGVARCPQARDEYDAYVPGVVALLRQDTATSVLAEHLVRIERSRMGLASNPERAAVVADVLVGFKRVLDERSPWLDA